MRLKKTIDTKELEKKAAEASTSSAPPTISFYEHVLNTLGINPPHAIEDGEIHRFGPKGCCWYALHRSSRGTLYGHYGDWRDPNKEDIEYCSRGKIEELPEDERREINEKTKEEQRKKKEFAERETERLRKEYPLLPSATADHPYLQEKHVKPTPAIRLDSEGSLVIPLYNNKGDLVSVQRIFPEKDENGRQKSYEQGIPVTALRFVIPGDFINIFLCEGVATGLSIHEATGATVVCAMSAGQLPNVAPDYPDAIIVADNDKSGAGEEWAKRAGLDYVLPPEVGMDANDYAVSYGAEALHTLLSPYMKTAPYSVPLSSLLTQPHFPPYLIKGFFSKGQLGACVGASGSGKTFVLLDMMLTLCCGLPFWQEAIYKTPGKKLNIYYLCGEGFEGVPKRVMAWLIMHPGAELGNINITRSPKNLDQKADLDFVMADMEKCRAEWGSIDLIVIDTYNQFNSGDENAADSVHAFLGNIARMRAALEYPCTILSHHTGVGENAQKRGRGSSAFRAALDFEFLIEKDEEHEGLLSLQQTKQKDLECLPPIGFKLHKTLIGWVDEDGEEITSAVITREKEGAEDTAQLAPAFHFLSLFKDEWQTKQGHFYAKEGSSYIVPKKDMKDFCRLYYKAYLGKEISDEAVKKALKKDREIGRLLGEKLEEYDRNLYRLKIAEREEVI